MLSIVPYHIKLPAQVLTDNSSAHFLQDVTTICLRRDMQGYVQQMQNQTVLGTFLNTEFTTLINQLR